MTPPTPTPLTICIEDPMYTEINNSNSPISPTLSTTSTIRPPFSPNSTIRTRSPSPELLQPVVYIPAHLLPPTPRPTIVLIPDAWHVPAHYARLTGKLNHAGYVTRVPWLPRNSMPDRGIMGLSAIISDVEKPPGLKDDVECVTSLLKGAIEKMEEEVVLVCHGYGGLPGSCAARQYLKSEREARGKKGGILGILYISAWALKTGESMAGFVAENPEWEMVGVDECKDGFSLPSRPEYYFYNDLPSNEVAYCLSKVVSHCSTGDSEPATADCAGGIVPITYLVCEKDNAIPVSIQKNFIKNLGKGCRVVGCGAGHSAFMSQWKLLMKLIMGMAGEDIPGERRLR